MIYKSNVRNSTRWNCEGKIDDDYLKIERFNNLFSDKEFTIYHETDHWKPVYYMNWPYPAAFCIKSLVYQFIAEIDNIIKNYGLPSWVDTDINWVQHTFVTNNMTIIIKCPMISARLLESAEPMWGRKYHDPQCLCY